jgi:receptor protein-tyrosine kinase
LAAPKIAMEAPSPEVAFHLLPIDTRPVIGPPTQDLVSYHRPEHPAARQFRRLTDGIAAQFPSGKSAVLLFTAASSPIAGNAAANIAVTRVNDGVGRVLVIEAERYDGSSARQFGVPEVPGLRELLARTVPLGLAIYRTGVDCVYCLPAGLARIGIDEAARMPALLDQLRSRFDWILVDAPPWGTHAMADWANASNGTYLVLKPDELDSPHVDATHEGISRAGGKLRGCVIVR